MFPRGLVSLGLLVFAFLLFQIYNIYYWKDPIVQTPKTIYIPAINTNTRVYEGQLIEENTNLSQMTNMTSNNNNEKFKSIHPSQKDDNTVKRKRVLLLTYMRSGSTFVGSMFLANSDIFYVLEPLHDFGKEKQISFLNGTRRTLDYESDTQQTMDDVFSCKLLSLSTGVLEDILWVHSTSGKQYRACILKKALTDCVSQQARLCSQRKLTAIKTIRYRMKTVERIIEKDRSLKVIHLVRDPRPAFASRMKYGNFKPYELREKSKYICTLMYEDVVATHRLLTTHPNQVKLILYEDITINTLNVVKEMYDFLDLPFKDEIRTHIMELKSNTTDCFMCLNRSNATHQLLKWRQSMNYTDVDIVDRNCKDVYDMVGYLPAQNEINLRNLSLSLRTTGLRARKVGLGQ